MIRARCSKQPNEAIVGGGTPTFVDGAIIFVLSTGIVAVGQGGRLACQGSVNQARRLPDRRERVLHTSENVQNFAATDRAVALRHDDCRGQSWRDLSQQRIDHELLRGLHHTCEKRVHEIIRNRLHIMRRFDLPSRDVWVCS